MREQKRVYCRPALVKHLRVMYNIGIASMFTIHQTLPHICAGLNTKYKPGVFHSTDGIHSSTSASHVMNGTSCQNAVLVLDQSALFSFI